MKTVTLLRTAFSHFRSHKGSRMGAALSYYAVFAIVPFGVLVIAIVGAIYGNSMVEANLVTQANTVIGVGSGDFIQSVISAVVDGAPGFWSTALSIAAILFAIVSVLSVLDSSLDELWEVKKEADIATIIKKKLVAFSIIPVVALLFLFFMSLGVALSFFVDTFSSITRIVQLLDPIILFIFGTMLIAFIFKMLPDRNFPMKDIVVGSAVTALLIVIGRLLIGYYINNFAHTNVYGAAGTLAALFIWVYYSAQVFFFGASFTYIYAKQKRA